MRLYATLETSIGFSKPRSADTISLVLIIIPHYLVAIHISPQASFSLFQEYISLFLSLLVKMAIPSALHGTPEVVGARTAQSLKTMASNQADIKPVNNSNVDIIDIRHDAVEVNLKEEILGSLRPMQGPKQLPTLLLYDERGLQIFEEVGSRWQMRGVIS